MRKGTVDTTVERPLTGEYQEFAELMEEVATLKPKQQERACFWLQGYVSAAIAINEREAATIQ